MFVGLLLVVVAGAVATAVPAVAANTVYLNVLDMQAAPTSPTDRRFNVLFDAGSWQGYSLPSGSGAGATGFVGPYVTGFHPGRWVGARFAEVTLQVADGNPVAVAELGQDSGPGYLIRRFGGSGLKLDETLFFAGPGVAVVKVDVASDVPRSVRLVVSGADIVGARDAIAAAPGEVIDTPPDGAGRLVTRISGQGATGTTKGLAYAMEVADPIRLTPGRVATLFVSQTLVRPGGHVASAEPDFAAAWQRNRARWARYLKVAADAGLPGLPDAVARRIVVKSIETLVGNWRAPLGAVHYAAVVPSYSNPGFDNGFWSWDSWKQAAALVAFAPRLARDNILALFDHQAPNGMIPDVIYPDPAEDNWRDSKPPLATWAVLKVYRATGDKAFLAGMYPKLVRYHRWWYENRDYAHDGLAEFGSTDGTVQAAKWESGMDDAARFDGVKMLRNGPHAWSMDQEAVDLNAYLYREDVELGEIADILGKPADARAWQARADELQTKIQRRFFDAKLGYFFDTTLPGNQFVTTWGPEGWTPLWTGVAAPAQAKAVARVLMNPRKFDTFLPFPTLAADDPRFAPVTGYWRGPVWFDQAYFAIAGLWRYGFTAEGDDMALRLLHNAQGLAGEGTIRENYDPLTGAGQNSQNFSWSAASCILLLLHGDRTRAVAPH